MVKRSYRESSLNNSLYEGYQEMPVLTPPVGNTYPNTYTPKGLKEENNFFNFSVEFRQDACHTLVRVSNNPFALLIGAVPILILYHALDCNPILDPPKLTPPTNEPYWFKVPIPLPGVTCVITFGMWTKHKVNLVIDVGGGHKTVGEMAAEGYYFRFDYIEDGTGIFCREYGTSQEDEITGYINYTYSVGYTANDVTNDGWIKFDLPTPQYYQDDSAPFLSGWEVLNNSCDNLPPPAENPWKPPPPPPMTCNCCPNIQQNDELLRLILKRIGEPKTVNIFDEDMEREGEQKANKPQETLFNAAKLNTDRIEIVNRLLGISNYPIEVPETMLVPHKEGFFESVFDFLDGNKTKKLNSLTEFLAWQVEQDSAVLGQFHQVLEFEEDFDGDGNARTEKVVLPNVAETLKELMLLIIQLANNDGLKTGMLMNILAEVSNCKVQLFKTMQTIIDIQDYLDYPTKTRTEQVDLLCNLKLTDDLLDFKDFMNNSRVPVTYEDWTGEASLHDNMLDLLQMAAMLRAMYFQRQ